MWSVFRISGLGGPVSRVFRVLGGQCLGFQDVLGFRVFGDFEEKRPAPQATLLPNPKA